MAHSVINIQNKLNRERSEEMETREKKGRGEKQKEFFRYSKQD